MSTSNAQANAPSANAAPRHVPRPTTFLGHLREWAEALMLAFLVAMFFRMFVVELFRIPSGSMSPTLIGDYATEMDLDGNGEADQIVVHVRSPNQVARIQIFWKIDGKYEGVDNFDSLGRGLRHTTGVGRLRQLSTSDQNRILESMAPRYDKILVNKLQYWLREPERGDVIVFKVPPSEFQVNKPIFIKRVAAVGGERVRIDTEGDLHVDGKRITEPEIMDRVWYYPQGPWYRSEARAAGAEVPEGHFLAFGDNSTSSHDSRAWGPVPVENAKGTAFFRYWPLSKFGYIDTDL